MKVLVVGKGGREHALVWKIIQSPKVSKIFCAPGNAGIAQLAECIEIEADDVSGLVRFAEGKNIDLTVVGSEDSLALGIVDIFRSRGLRIFGPTRAAAKIEWSKAFAKRLMRGNSIPTASFRIFRNYNRALYYICEHGVPTVIKVSG